MAEKNFEVSVRGMQLRGIRFGQGKPLLALHGWLDNAASFSKLAPLLTGYEVFAVDLPGHGLSDHLPAQQHYHVWQGTEDVELLADALGLTEFALMGHSMGAAIATLYAAVFPQRISHLVLLDALGPLTHEPVQAVDNMRDAILQMKAIKPEQRVLPAAESFISTRLQGPLALQQEAAELIVGRAIQAVPGGFCWRSDKRLKNPSLLRLSNEQLQAFLQAIRAPVLGLFASDGIYTREFIDGRWQHLQANKELHWLIGGHHFHLQGDVADVARRVLAFLGK
ncbi:MAG: alpha/beta hydrolase [Oceanospirillaceae bacterium]|nr:alpha/beta hydrolase [Oceanospirillaceae bacterium]MCP5351536.1 alpha/beta hydrolase [Oceanospirillaceae bacterium]